MKLSKIFSAAIAVYGLLVMPGIVLADYAGSVQKEDVEEGFRIEY